MSQLDLANTASTSIITPASGIASVFIDSDKALKIKDDAGFINGLGIDNCSIASQTPTAATRTYITGSMITIPVGKMQIKTMFHWKWDMTKTAAGTATSTIDIAVGTNGTTGDTARVSFTKPVGTAVVDVAWCEIFATVRGPLSGSGVIAGTFILSHNLASTGHATIPNVVVSTESAGFDITVANLKVGICITTGASDAITIRQMQAFARNL